jgi:hypothetical protein
LLTSTIRTPLGAMSQPGTPQRAPQSPRASVAGSAVEEPPDISPEIFQVADSELALKEAILAGEIPRPGLVTWNTWQVWRKFIGRRPKVAPAGRRLPGNPEESYLWRLVMLTFHGEDWNAELARIGYGSDPATLTAIAAARADVTGGSPQSGRGQKGSPGSRGTPSEVGSLT